MSRIFKKQEEYVCECGGSIETCQINYNDVLWKCTRCKTDAIVDLIEVPSYFVMRREKVND